MECDSFISAYLGSAQAHQPAAVTDGGSERQELTQDVI